MQTAVHEAAYFPTIKWKQGERAALASCRAGSRRLLIPNIVLPPAGAFDHDKGRPLSPSEHVRSFGPRLAEVWGQVPAFVDAVLIDDAQHAEGLSAHPLTELLERARLHRAIACPVTSLDRTGAYQDAVVRFVDRQTRLPISLRVSAAELETRSLRRDIASLLSTLRTQAAQVFLNIDFADNIPLTREAAEDFVALLEERLNNFPYLHEWLQIAVSMTSFPVKPAIKAGQTIDYPRVDWAIYRRLVGERQLLRTPAYGDYAVDAAPFSKAVEKVIPSAQFRHTSEIAYTIVKGKQAKKPLGYKEIYPVADRLVALDGFPRGTRSDGDVYADALSSRAVGPGSAPKWRWAATDHHFSLVTKGVGLLTDRPVIEDATQASEGEQWSLFSS